jgi:hypothetical protein
VTFDPARSVFIRAPPNSTKADVTRVLERLGVHITKLHINQKLYFAQLASVAEQTVMLTADKTQLLVDTRALVVAPYEPYKKERKATPKAKAAVASVVDKSADRDADKDEDYDDDDEVAAAYASANAASPATTPIKATTSATSTTTPSTTTTAMSTTTPSTTTTATSTTTPSATTSATRIATTTTATTTAPSTTTATPSTSTTNTSTPSTTSTMSTPLKSTTPKAPPATSNPATPTGVVKDRAETLDKLVGVIVPYLKRGRSPLYKAVMALHLAEPFPFTKGDAAALLDYMLKHDNAYGPELRIDVNNQKDKGYWVFWLASNGKPAPLSRYAATSQTLSPAALAKEADRSVPPPSAATATATAAPIVPTAPAAPARQLTNEERDRIVEEVAAKTLRVLQSNKFSYIAVSRLRSSLQMPLYNCTNDDVATFVDYMVKHRRFQKLDCEVSSAAVNDVGYAVLRLRKERDVSAAASAGAVAVAAVPAVALPPLPTGPASVRWPVTLVETPERCEAAASALKSHSTVALSVFGAVDGASDARFVRLVCVAVMVEPSMRTADAAAIGDLQMHSRGAVYAFDLKSKSAAVEAASCALLVALLRDEQITKVMFDARNWLPALKRRLQLMQTEVGNVHDLLVGVHMLQRARALPAPLPPHASASDVLLALGVPLTVASDALPPSVAVSRAAPLLRVQVECAAECARYLLQARALMQLALTSAVERWSKVGAQWFASHSGALTATVLPAGEPCTLAFEVSRIGGSGRAVVRLFAERRVHTPLTPQKEQALARLTRLRVAETAHAEIDLLLDVLPATLRAALLSYAGLNRRALASVQSVFVAAQRAATLQLHDGGGIVTLDDCVCSGAELAALEQPYRQHNDLWPDGDVVVIDRTLHRLKVRRSAGQIVGLKCQLVLPFAGAAPLLSDVLARLANERIAVLLFGAGLSGKTSVLRELACELAKSLRTVVVDTYGDVAGDGTTRHPSLGDAVPLPVRTRPEHDDAQASTVLEAAQTWNADVVVVDELYSPAQTTSVAWLAAHGVGSLCGVAAPSLKALRDDARSLLRERNPFSVAIEVRSFHKFQVYADFGSNFKSLLAAVPQSSRWLDAGGQAWIQCTADTSVDDIIRGGGDPWLEQLRDEAC